MHKTDKVFLLRFRLTSREEPVLIKGVIKPLPQQREGLGVIDFCGRLKLDNYSLVTGIVLEDYFFFCINTLTSKFDC